MSKVLQGSVTRRRYPVLFPCILEQFGGYGVSIYRGVVILWDEDYDVRALDYIDENWPLSENHDLPLAIHEHKGSIDLIWESSTDCIGFEADKYKGDYWEPTHWLNGEPLTDITPP